MSTYVQKNAPMKVSSPLGPDALLLETFTANEQISSLFSIQLDLLADSSKAIDFKKLLGNPFHVSVDQPDQTQRHFHGIAVKISQGGQVYAPAIHVKFTKYRAELVPMLWYLQRREQSRIFQQISVPDILKTVLTGIDTKFELQGNYEPRDYCTQYRESDFAFASRLMEEEGIYYYFVHSNDNHIMVIADSNLSHRAVEPEAIAYEPMVGGNRPEDRIHSWEKVQEVRSISQTLWDFCFEMPDKNLEAKSPIQNSATVGTVPHSLKAGASENLELYDYPGRYAQRFDGIEPGGGDRAADLGKIFSDNKRTAGLRMQEEAANAIAVHGSSDCPQLSAGYKFTLKNHFDGNGQYVLTGVKHYATQGGAFGTSHSEASYSNTFDAIPMSLPFRPQSVTTESRVMGTQTATVVGPKGEEIFTDKYGRVKVQFHWDRHGKKDVNSSCWVRVATLWAGTQWGMIHIPRIGQEVVVAFEEGDPDRPIIVGSVYNAANMPPYALPDNRTQSGFKSRSTLKGDGGTFHELRFEDKKDNEEIYFHSQKDFNRVVENNDTIKVGFEKKDKGDRTIEIFNNEKITIGAGKGAQADGSQTTSIFRDRISTIETGNDKHTIKMGNRDTQLDLGSDSLLIKMGNQTTKVSLGSSKSEAMQSIELTVGQSSITIDQMGVTIKGINVKVEGNALAELTAPMAKVTGSAMCKVGGGITMIG